MKEVARTTGGHLPLGISICAFDCWFNINVTAGHQICHIVMYHDVHSIVQTGAVYSIRSPWAGLIYISYNIKTTTGGVNNIDNLVTMAPSRGGIYQTASKQSVLDVDLFGSRKNGQI